MDLFKLTRTLIDIDSVIANESEVGVYLLGYLSDLAKRHGGEVERLEVAPLRFNVYARWGDPVVTLSTHVDTVPPFIPSRKDDNYIWGRGACDAKGIVAAMIAAAERLLEVGIRNFGLLFVVGEERGSSGAIAAAKTPRGSRYVINGQPGKPVGTRVEGSTALRDHRSRKACTFCLPRNGPLRDPYAS